MAEHDTPLDRACAALLGVALGDAMGMPTQTLSRADIRQRYGEITGFVAPFEDHPVSNGLWAAQVTDDTEQTMLLAARLIDGGGEIDDVAWARDLLRWEADVHARGLRDLLGPSSKAALSALMSGVPPSETGRAGTTNGAAMRIAPIGIMTPPAPLGALIDRVERACRLTHNTGEAIAAASAVAAVISCGVDGAAFDDTLEVARAAALEGQTRGHGSGGGGIAQHIADAIALVDGTGSEDALATRIGTSVASRESVPAAFGVVRRAQGDPWRAALLAANIGDDTDTIGAIACAMAGACGGCSAFPAEALSTLRAANDLAIEETAAALLDLRARLVVAPGGPLRRATT